MINTYLEELSLEKVNLDIIPRRLTVRERIVIKKLKPGFNFQTLCYFYSS